MAYENNETLVLADIQKGNRGDVIRISKITNKANGNVSGDIRMYYENEDGELAPTKKGCRFNAESTYDIVAALVELMTVDELENLATLVADKLCDDEPAEDEGTGEE